MRNVGGEGNDGRGEWSRERGRWFVAECGDVGWVQYVDAVGGSLVVKGVEGREGCVIANKNQNFERGRPMKIAYRVYSSS